MFWEIGHPPTATPYLRVWMTGPPLSQGLDPALVCSLRTNLGLGVNHLIRELSWKKRAWSRFNSVRKGPYLVTWDRLVHKHIVH